MKKTVALRKGTTADKNLIRWECYNPNKFDIVFTLMENMVPYINMNRITLGARRIVCKSEGWAILNHSYYIPTASNGADHFEVRQIYGDRIGKGEKYPSRPDAYRTQVSVK